MALSSAGVRLLMGALARSASVRAVTVSASGTGTMPFLSGSLPAAVDIYEVGPRDGLQNEQTQVPVEVKTELIERLVGAGLKLIEATSFVSPKWVPQLADAADVMAKIPRPEGVRYPVLTPNMKGFVSPVAAAKVAKELYDMGCYEVSMADTTGVGTPASVARMFEETKKLVPVEKLAAHMHDTYGQALANILASMQCGVSIIDTSIAGLGGCPYAKGATGNVATEDVVFMLDGFGIHHGLDMEKLLGASDFISRALGRENSSRAARALLIARKSTL